MNVLMLCPSHYGGLLPSMGHQLVEIAALALGIQDRVVINGAMSNDVAHGKDIINTTPLMDRYLLFGKTCASLDMPEMPEFVVVNNALRLPSLVDLWWWDPDNTALAITSTITLLGN